MKKTFLYVVIAAGVVIPLCGYVAKQTDIKDKHRRIDIQLELNKLDYEQYASKASASDARIVDLEDRIAQAEEHRDLAEAENDPLGVLYAESIISECMEKTKEAQQEFVDSKLQEELSYFYIEHDDAIAESRKRNIDYLAFQNYLEILRQEYQIEYQSVLIEELEEKRNIEKYKLSRGYTTQLMFNRADALLENAKLQLKIEEERLEYLEDYAYMNDANYKKQAIWEEVISLKNPDQYVEQFLDSSIQLKLFSQQVEAYKNYLKSKEDDDTEKIRLQLELTQLNREQYETDLELYVRQQVLNYNTLEGNIYALDNQIDIMEQEISINKLLYDKGKITWTRLMELETQLQKLKYERGGLICDVHSVFYILEHQIENDVLE